MLIYRYENKDGGGPFFTKNGSLRSDNSIHFDDDMLSGCLSLESLIEYWNKQENRELYLQDCIIKIYEVPKEEIKQLHSHVIFPQKYAPIN
jgi:hypothetical protein